MNVTNWLANTWDGTLTSLVNYNHPQLATFTRRYHATSGSTEVRRQRKEENFQKICQVYMRCINRELSACSPALRTTIRDKLCSLLKRNDEADLKNEIVRGQIEALVRGALQVEMKRSCEIDRPAKLARPSAPDDEADSYDNSSESDSDNLFRIDISASRWRQTSFDDLDNFTTELLILFSANRRLEETRFTIRIN